MSNLTHLIIKRIMRGKLRERARQREKESERFKKDDNN